MLPRVRSCVLSHGLPCGLSCERPKLLGHDDISTTAKYYVNVSADEKARAIETLELNLAVPC